MATTIFIVLLISISVSSVTGVDISVSPTNLNEGATLTITCREQSLPQGTTLYSLILQMARDTQGYVHVLRYDINVHDPAGDPYLPTWGDNAGDLQQRANFTPTFGPDRTSLSFEFRLYSVRCTDAASFRCRRTASGNAGTQDSDVQNVTIHGVTQSIEITGAQDCATFIDPDCAQCWNFDDRFGVRPKYARMGQPLLLTCAGQLATPTSQNKAIWYRQNLNDLEKVLLTVNTTELEYDPPSPNACSVRGRSTLAYYPQPTDRELRITCEITSTSSFDTVSEKMSICVEGLINVANTVRPGVTHIQTTPEPVTGVEISVLPVNLNEGSTLTITCTQRSLPQGTTLFNLALQKSTDTGGYNNVLIYNINVNDPTGDLYLPTWGNNLGDLQQRANFTPTFGSDRTSLSFAFRIYSVTCSDAASFRCRRTASGSEGFLASNVQNATVDGRCLYPQIVGDIFPEVKRRSETGYLNCTVSRQQTNTVYWIQSLDGVIDNWISSDTEILARNDVVNGKQKYEVIRRFRGNDKITYTLVVNRLREEDSGRYKCTVFLVGKPQSEWPYKYGNMTVQVPPTIIVSQTSNAIQRNQGSNVTLSCNATGTPTPNITWVRANDMPLPDGRLSHRGHFLDIINIKKDDRGIYRCLADNNVIPPAHHDAKLMVNFKPEAVAVQDTVGQAQNRRFHALLECRIKGMPEPNLGWYMITDTGPVRLRDNEKYDINQLLTHGTSLQLNDVWYTLKILNVQANDYGTYYCEGSNDLGTSRAEIRLHETQECRGPDCPTIFSTTYAPLYRTPASVQNITRTSAILLIDLRDPPTQWTSTGYRISCEESKDKTLVYNIEIEKKDPSWGDGTVRFILIGLSPGSRYSCQASSQTPVGPGWMERFSFMTSYPEMVSDARTTLRWQHAVGLSVAGLLAFWSVLVLQMVTA